MPAPDLLVDHVGCLATLKGPKGPRRGAALRDLGLVAQAAVAVVGDRIVAAGPRAEVLAEWAPGPNTQVLDAKGQLVTPGLVDPHTHLVWAGDRMAEHELRHGGATYAEIFAAGGGIHRSVSATRAASEAELKAAGRATLDRFLRHGTTALEAKSGYGLDLATELKQLRVVKALAAEGPQLIDPTFMGAHAVPQGQDAEAFTTQVVEGMLPAVAAEGLATHADVFVEKGVFTPAQGERIGRAAQALGLKLRLHVDELCDLGGGALAARLGATTADHLLFASEASIHALAASDTIAVMLPGTPFFLNMAERAPARALIDAGAIVALGTDFNPGSCFSESMPMMMTLAVLQLKMSPAEALSACTVNAAHAIGRGADLGRLEPGCRADLVVWEAPEPRHLSMHFGVNLAQSVVVAGQVRWGLN